MNVAHKSFSLPSWVERWRGDVVFQSPLLHPRGHQSKPFREQARRGYTDEWDYMPVTEVLPQYGLRTESLQIFTQPHITITLYGTIDGTFRR
jgi:hypothetical protein